MPRSPSRRKPANNPGASPPKDRQTRPARGVAQGRDARSAATRAAIIDAALDEFAARGFAAARLDDIARRAKVAKGTIYVHFRDKESLFEELVRSALGPLLRSMEALPRAELSLRALAEQLVDLFVRDVLQARRKHVVRLIISEGPRFPALAQIYYREVIKRALPIIRGAAERAVARGEVRSDALNRFPQLLVAPGILAIVWDMLFASYEPLDAAGIMRAQLELIFGAVESGP